MEKKFEKLDDSIIKKIKDNQDKAGSIIVEVGQLHFRKKDIEKELEKTKTLISIKESEFESLNSEISKVIDELTEKYPDGELDLNQGGVYY